jgi:hypothetical protein
MLLSKITGELSLIRVLVLLACVVGTAGFICGIVGFFLGKPDSIALCTINAGMFSSLFAKAWEKQAEVKAGSDLKEINEFIEANTDDGK